MSDVPSKTRFLTLSVENQVARVTLNRPDVHNAFNPELIEELRTTFTALAQQAPVDVRAIVLAGNGKSFCAGADVNWMSESLRYTEEQNVADAHHMASMFHAINRCPAPVIGRVHGAALGGGVGLAAVCDVVVAEESTIWALSEVKLGLAPAVISPYVLAKIGRSHARALFLTGERFDTQRAIRIGLAHKSAPLESLDGEVEKIASQVLQSAPHGIARAKELIELVPSLAPEEATQLTAETIAALRVSPEGQEGLRAFLEKRKPEWAS
jgi:methylglutaconyl-CoA hydratase